MGNVSRKGVAENRTQDLYGVYAPARFTLNGTVYLFGGNSSVSQRNQYRWVETLRFFQKAPGPVPKPKAKTFHLSPTAVVILIGGCGVVALIVIAIYAKRRSDRAKRAENQYLVQHG